MNNLKSSLVQTEKRFKLLREPKSLFSQENIFGEIKQTYADHPKLFVPVEPPGQGVEPKTECYAATSRCKTIVLKPHKNLGPNARVKLENLGSTGKIEHKMDRDRARNECV